MESRVQNPLVGMKSSLCGLYWAFCFSWASWLVQPPDLVNRNFSLIVICTPRGEEPARQCRRHRGLVFSPGAGRSPGEGHSNPLQYSCPDNPMDRGAWWARVHGVAIESAATEHRHTQVPSLITLLAYHVLPILFIYINNTCLWKTSQMLLPFWSPSWVSSSFPVFPVSALQTRNHPVCMHSVMFSSFQPHVAHLPPLSMEFSR